MTDDADRADQEIERHLAEALRTARKPIPEGTPGDCDLCGEWSARLVNGACAPCRDKWGLG
jgi:hypothetical protein